ncbi:hypothetical protein [Limibacillus halophilus]|jgi:hypothetical protein
MTKNFIAIMLLGLLAFSTLEAILNVKDGLMNAKREMERIEEALRTEPAAGRSLADGNAK